MSAEPALIDTNVLVYALFAGNPEHAPSSALLQPHCMATTAQKLGPKYQVTIPKPVRNALGL